MQQTQATRFTLVRRDEFSIDLEYNEDSVAIHLPYARNLSKGVVLEAQRVVSGILAFVKTAGYPGLIAAVDREGTSIIKLLGILGFTLKGETEEYLVYWRE